MIFFDANDNDDVYGLNRFLSSVSRIQFLVNSPHPVSCRCRVPADYCTLAPESDVPVRKKKQQHVLMWRSIFSRRVQKQLRRLVLGASSPFYLITDQINTDGAECQSDSWQICLLERFFEAGYWHSSTFGLKLLPGDISAAPLKAVQEIKSLLPEMCCFHFQPGGATTLYLDFCWQTSHFWQRRFTWVWL